MGSKGIELPSGITKVKCQVFKDNIRAKLIATIPRIRPCTKHINIKYWHFVEYNVQNRIDNQLVRSEDQLADILTKPLPAYDFNRLHDKIIGKEMANSTHVFK